MTTLRTPTEYRVSLQEIECLWEAEPDTEEGKQLVECLAAVERYEQLNTPEPVL